MILDEVVLGFAEKVAMGAGAVLGLILLLSFRIPRRIKAAAFLRSRN